MTLESFIIDACVVLNKDIDKLEPLVGSLRRANSLVEKLDILNTVPAVIEFLEKPSFVRSFLSGLNEECELVIKSVIAIGQADKIFAAEVLSDKEKIVRLRQIVENLLPIEQFYREIGGVVGYHLTMIKFLCRPILSHSEKAVYHAPQGVDISEPNRLVRQAIREAIAKMEEIGEIYPVGGTADRLRLVDPATGLALPAARLFFCGKTLLERLVVDVQAREYLFYKLKGRQIQIPIAMMTSKEKDNHQQILSLCQEKNWFERGKGAFSFFCQPSVPTLNKEGNWGLQGEMQLLLRPGGHGVIWKLARDEGVFKWFKDRGVKKALVRQINNPIAAEDYGLLAFSGLGQSEDRWLGFCSCPRQIKASEGINVLVEEKKKIGREYTLTNIEYCDFKKYGIADEPSFKGSLYSKFPSNTNLLFIDIGAIESALEACPIPGMLVNLKKIGYRNENGEIKEQELARLESTMQNIADCFKEFSLEGALDLKRLKSFLTFNHRRKTISTTKREYSLGSSLLETPEGCFIDMMHNAKDLLENYCNFVVPQVKDADGGELMPSFLFFYHPALGPLYSIIGQKIQGGVVYRGAEMQLHIAELEMRNVDVLGSLLIRAQHIMGEPDQSGTLQYSDKTGKCVLTNVKIENEGIDYRAPNVFWKNEIHRRQCCLIELEVDAEFVAEGVTFSGNFYCKVKAGFRVTFTMQEGNLVFKEERIAEPLPSWRYAFDSDDFIVLSK